MLRIATCLWLLMAITGCQSKQKALPPASTSISCDLLQNGDIILRMGHGIISETIAQVLNDSLEVSHCGIIEKADSTCIVIHSLSAGVADLDGMQSCSLSSFDKDSKAGSTIVVRFKGNNNQLIAKKARHYLSLKKPFDNLLNPTDTTAFFCSELVIRILADELNVNLLEGKEPSYASCKFSLFLNPQYFDVIVDQTKL